MVQSIIIGMMVGTAAGMTCPSTPSWVAAGMKITTVATTSCDKVEAEIKARINGQSTKAWHDPHNNGKYTLQNYGGTLSSSRLTGDGKYTDKQIFTLTPDGGNCKIEACSRSQVFSIFDLGTNYCDLKMLYCGTADGCKPVDNDFTVNAETTEKFSQASVDLSACLKVSEEAVKVQHSDAMTCPSTPAWVAAGMKITTVASASCDKVEAEIKARVNGQATKAWHDPHNNGKYTLHNYGGTLSTSRLTGDGKYTDKQIFTLTPDGSHCKVDACSRSQVFSVLDMGTNYCDLKMLYCGTADGCKPVDNDFTVSAETTEKFSQASVDLKKCLVTAEASVVV
jgi:uncharacterized protein (DUF2147 family)